MDKPIRKRLICRGTACRAQAKYRCPKHPQALSRFLSGSIAEQLRWCPKCLAMERYYRLIWRFRGLTGCPHHQCGLWACRPHCGKPVPLFTAPSGIGICASCGKDLSSCRSLPLAEDELVPVSTCFDSLKFLLTPQPWETNSTQVVRVLGRHMQRLRKRRGLSGIEASRAIGVTQTAIAGIEQGNITRRGATFDEYFRYAQFPGVSLPYLLESTVEEINNHGTLNDRQRRKNELFCEVAAVVEELKATGQRVNQRRVAALMGVSPGTLRNYPAIAEYIRQQADFCKVTVVRSKLKK